VHYYWPIVEQDIPQTHGGEKTKPLAFRCDPKGLTDVYSRKGYNVGINVGTAAGQTVSIATSI
jgi:hypothetical protein